jgi:hypothetical protein
LADGPRPRQRLRHRGLSRAGARAVVLLGLAWLASSPASGQPPDDELLRQEYNVKAAFLYSFGRYVEWPAGALGPAGAPFTIGVLGGDPFHGALDEIARTRKLQGRPLAVRYFASWADYRPCQVLFIAGNVPLEQQEAAVRKLRGAAVLLVGETEGFAARGGGVNFYREQQNVRFEINVEALRGQRLQINAKLLSLARPVKGA